MKTIIYQPGGHCISDFDVSKFVDQLIKSTDPIEARISNFLVIEEVRARIAEGALTHDFFEIKVIGETGLVPFKIDKHGRCEDWIPAMQVYEDVLTRIILPQKKRSMIQPETKTKPDVQPCDLFGATAAGNARKQWHTRSFR